MDLLESEEGVFTVASKEYWLSKGCQFGDSEELVP